MQLVGLSDNKQPVTYFAAFFLSFTPLDALSAHTYSSATVSRIIPFWNNEWKATKNNYENSCFPCSHMCVCLFLCTILVSLLGNSCISPEKFILARLLDGSQTIHNCISNSVRISFSFLPGTLKRVNLLCYSTSLFYQNSCHIWPRREVARLAAVTCSLTGGVNEPTSSFHFNVTPLSLSSLTPNK